MNSITPRTAKIVRENVHTLIGGLVQQPRASRALSTRPGNLARMRIAAALSGSPALHARARVATLLAEPRA